MFSINANWRVVQDKMQWVLQRKQGERWRDRSFCVTREALLRCIREQCGESADLSAANCLPELHPSRDGHSGLSGLLPPSYGAETVAYVKGLCFGSKQHRLVGRIS